MWMKISHREQFKSCGNLVAKFLITGERQKKELPIGNPLAYRWVTENLFGKRILVTCRKDWTEEEIIAAYRGQSNIERVFRHFKNPYHHAVHPQFHWTDQKIKVHTFICVTGLLLSQLLWKKACTAGYALSIENLLDRLMEIRETEVVTITDLKGRPQKEVQLEEVEPWLQKLYEKMMNEAL